MFKRELGNLYSEETLQLDYKSCEMLADELHSYISEKYPNRGVWIEISEDEENGAHIRYES